VRPKRLKWVKTVHQGSESDSFEFELGSESKSS